MKRTLPFRLSCLELTPWREAVDSIVLISTFSWGEVMEAVKEILPGWEAVR